MKRDILRVGLQNPDSAAINGGMEVAALGKWIFLQSRFEDRDFE